MGRYDVILNGLNLSLQSQSGVRDILKEGELRGLAKANELSISGYRARGRTSQKLLPKTEAP